MGCIQTDRSILRLNDIIFSKVTDAIIIFNTVKQSNPCMGKTVQYKLNTTKFSVVNRWCEQLWDKTYIRKMPWYCTIHILLLTVAINVSNSHLQNIKTSEINTVTKEQLIKALFHWAREIMIKTLTIQSNICESSRDARGSVRPKILFRWPYDFGIGAHRRMHLLKQWNDISAFRKSFTKVQ